MPPRSCCSQRELPDQLGKPISDGADIYVTHTPCIHCFKTLVNTGIKRMVYAKPYKLETLEELRRNTGVELVRIASGGH